MCGDGAEPVVADGGLSGAGVAVCVVVQDEGASAVSSGSCRATSPWILVSWRTVLPLPLPLPLPLVVAARSPEAESCLLPRAARLKPDGRHQTPDVTQG